MIQRLGFSFVSVFSFILQSAVIMCTMFICVPILHEEKIWKLKTLTKHFILFLKNPSEKALVNLRNHESQIQAHFTIPIEKKYKNINDAGAQLKERVLLYTVKPTFKF